MEKFIRILLIEDIPEDVRYAQIQLKQIFGDRHTVDVVDYFSKAVQQLQIKTFDIIILDLSLPDSRGLDNFKNILDSYNTPVIIYTGLDNELVKSEALKYGAVDYLIKGHTNTNTLKTSIANSIIRNNI